MIECVVFNQLYSFLSKNNLLNAKQSDFRRGHSTETAQLSVTEILRIAKSDSKSSVLILLDLSATFDTVNHQILLTTLSSLGIIGIPLRWFESYLNGMSFKVTWGGEESTEHQLVTGVSQGDVLRPLLLFTYKTSLGLIIQTHGFSYHCYADDTQLYISFRPDDPTVAAKTTLQKLLDLAGLHCTTSERSGPSLHSMQHNFLSRPLSFLDWTIAMLL